MSLIRRTWTAEAADEWTKEDYLGMLFASLSYVCIAIGTPLAFFFWWGWLIAGAGIASLLLMLYIVDPKLRALSTEYEQRQKGYLEELDRINRWED